MTERILTAEEVHLIRDCMVKLSAYHDSVTTHPDFHFRPTYVDNVLEKMAENIPEGKTKVKVLEDDGAVAGFASISLNTENSKGHLSWLFLEEACRGKGYGGKLIDWAMEEFHALKLETIDINCVCGNPAMELYKKYGFSPRVVTLTKCETYGE